MADSFNHYFDAIKKSDPSESTEYTLRGALENLLKAAIADTGSKIRVIHEPKRDKTGLGAPDFKFKLHEAVVGYLENKDIGEDLDATLKSDQLTK